jgi:tetratricopeptide (TPR) repeat protein
VITALAEEVAEIATAGKEFLNAKAEETKATASAAWSSGKSGWFSTHAHATIEQLEAAQIFCESRALLALVQFRNKEYTRGAINVRTAATSYFSLGDALKIHPEAGPVWAALEDGKVETLKVDKADPATRRLFELVTAVLLGVAIFRYFTSLIPPSFQWIAKALGFQIDRNLGLQHIRAVAQTVLVWSPPRDLDTLEKEHAAASSAAPGSASSHKLTARPSPSSKDITPHKDSEHIPPRAPFGPLLAAWVECFQTEQFDRCDEIVAACLRVWPRGGMFSYLGGYLARRAGDMSLAIRLFDHSLGAFAGYFEHATQGCLYEKAQCMMLTGNWADAATMYEHFLHGYKGKNNAACAWQELGYCRHGLGKAAEADDAMRHAPKLVREQYTFDRFNGRRAQEYVDNGGVARAEWLAMGAWYLFRGGRPGDALAFCMRCSEILDQVFEAGEGKSVRSWVDAALASAPAVDASKLTEIPPPTDNDLVEVEGGIAPGFVEGCKVFPEWAARDASSDLATGDAMLVPGSSAYASQIELDRTVARPAAAIMLLARGRTLASLALSEIGHPARHAKSARSTVTRNMAYEITHGEAAKYMPATGSMRDDMEDDILLVKAKADSRTIMNRARACLSLAIELGKGTHEEWVAPHAHYFYATTYTPAPDAEPTADAAHEAKKHIELALAFAKYDFDKPLFRSLSALKDRF